MTSVKFYCRTGAMVIWCKLCSDNLTDRNNKNRLKTVASVYTDLFDLVNNLCEIARVSKPDIHQFLLVELKYLYKECHSIITKQTNKKDTQTRILL